MKRLSFLFFCIVIIVTNINAQASDAAVQKNKEFTGAVASKKMYNAIFQLDTNDPKIIHKTIRNINNALNDPRLNGKLNIELIAFSGGTDAYLTGAEFENDLKELVEKGVIIAQCNNTLKERKITRDQLFNFVAFVPSGTGELIIRQSQGWSIVKP